VKWLGVACARAEGSPFLGALAAAGFAAHEAPYDSETIVAELDALLAGLPAPGAILLATYDAHRKPGVGRAAAHLAARAPIFHLALGWPDDLPESPLRASVSTFGCGWEAVHFGVSVLAGHARLKARALV
jgi:hypothetical protein